MELRLVPVNAVLDLALLDGLNPAPLADEGWQIVGLEIPVITRSGTVVCDVVMFNPTIGSLLAVEAKSGANIEPDQARKLAEIDPHDLVIAGGITIPRPVPLRCEPLIVCLGERVPRIIHGLDAIGLTVPVLAVDATAARLVDVKAASPELSTALGRTITWVYPVATIIRFDHQSPDNAFDQPVRAELVSEMARGRTAVTVRALAEQVTSHFAVYGRRAQGQLVKKVQGAARRAAEADPDRFVFQPSTGSTDARILIVRSPELVDRRGRTQSYQAVFGERGGRKRAVTAAPEQLDLFSVLDEAERASSEDVYENGGDSADDAVSQDGGGA